MMSELRENLDFYQRLQALLEESIKLRMKISDDDCSKIRRVCDAVDNLSRTIVAEMSMLSSKGFMD